MSVFMHVPQQMTMQKKYITHLFFMFLFIFLISLLLYILSILLHLKIIRLIVFTQMIL
jgi:hypothetical protein